MAIDYVGKKCIMTNEGQWSAQTAYEPLCFVTDTNGNSYCSKIDVPAGTPLENTTYWIPQGSTSGEIEYAKQLATQASQDATEALTQVADKVSKTDVVSTAEDLQTVVAEGKLADAVLMKKAYKDADDSITAIGTMTDLQTTEKTTLVGAINEAYNRQPDVLATKEEVEANTQAGMIADALVTKELSTEVAQLNQSMSAQYATKTYSESMLPFTNGISDCNNMTSMGIYTCMSPAHSPKTGHCTIFTIPFGGLRSGDTRYCRQLLFHIGDNTIYSRYNWENVWSEWVNIGK